jgi:hypothetical protein
VSITPDVSAFKEATLTFSAACCFAPSQTIAYDVTITDGGSWTLDSFTVPIPQTGPIMVTRHYDYLPTQLHITLSQDPTQPLFPVNWNMTLYGRAN